LDSSFANKGYPEVNADSTGMVLVTGATGFLGSALAARLAREGPKTRLCVRGSTMAFPHSLEISKIEDMTSQTNWTQALSGVSCVIHTAARVHVMIDDAIEPLAEFRSVNVDGTLNLAKQAAAAGVRRFVFISSIKVNGESTPAGRPFSERDVASPLDPYGISKHEAELGLRDIAAQTGMGVVIIRPPLVYGPGVKANFAVLAGAMGKGWPLPLGGLHNKRSLVALDNLVDFILTCVSHPDAANQTFLVSDDHDLSTTELARGLANWIDRPARLLPVPSWVIRAAGAALGKSAAVQRLTGNLQVDISKAKNVLGWTPPITVDEGLRRVMLGLGKA
jgi:nucleoside-diphosphate-sugar epimerase